MASPVPTAEVNPMLRLLRQIEGSLHDIASHQSSLATENGRNGSSPKSATARKNAKTESEFDRMVEDHAEEWNGLQELHLLVLNWRFLLENSRKQSAAPCAGGDDKAKSDNGSGEKTARLRKLYCDAIVRSRALTIVFRKIVEQPDLAEQLVSSYRDHSSLSGAVNGDAKADVCCPADGDAEDADTNCCSSSSSSSSASTQGQLDVSHSPGSDTTSVQGNDRKDSDLEQAEEESAILLPKPLDSDEEKAAAIQQDTVVENLRMSMVLIGIDIEESTMKSMLSLLYHISQQRRLAEQLLSGIKSQFQAIVPSSSAGMEEVLAINDRLETLIDSAVNIAISVLRPQPETRELFSIQQLFGSLSSPMQELVVLWDRLAFESEPAASAGERSVWQDGDEDAPQPGFPHLSSMALKIGDKGLRLAKQLEAEAQARKDDGAQSNSSMISALTNMKAKLQDTIQSAQRHRGDIAAHYKDKGRALEGEQRGQAHLRQSLGSERDSILARRAELLQELAALDDKLEHTEEKIRGVVSAEEDLAGQTREIGSALHAIDELEASQRQCEAACEALWQSSSDVVELFQQNFAQVSDRAIQTGVSAVESTLSMKCRAISSKASLVQSEIGLQTERSKLYAGQVITKSRSFGRESFDDVSLERDDEEEELRGIAESKRDFTRTRSKLLTIEKDIEMMSSELQAIESDACQSLPDRDRLRAQCESAHLELSRAQAMLEESKRDYESTLDRLATG